MAGFCAPPDLLNLSYRQTTQGKGQRSDFTKVAGVGDGPDAKYNHFILDSLAALSKKKNKPSLHGFYNPYSKYDKIIEKGMERIYYGRETIGPGAYMSLGVPVLTTKY